MSCCIIGSWSCNTSPSYLELVRASEDGVMNALEWDLLFQRLNLVRKNLRDDESGGQSVN